jgi:glycosyltransferase involved in cell wall biosynthesis
MKKAKILLLTNACTVGGAEMHLLSLAKHLNKDKYDLSLVYLIEKPDDARSLKGDFIATGIKVIDLESRGRYDPLPVLKVAKLIRDCKFDIVHAHLFHAEIVGRLAMILGSVRIFVTTYHNAEEFLKNPFWAWVARRIASKAHQVIVISDAVGRYLVDKSAASSDKIKRIYYGLEFKDGLVGARLAAIRDEYGIDKNYPIIGMIARYAPQKGHRYILEAMVEVLKELPNVRLLLAGHDEKGIKGSLEKCAKGLGIREKVVFSGFRADVYELLHQFDIFVLPSLWEGFGLVLLEAMAVGKAIVATNVGPIPEVIKDGETGFLVPPGDPAAMAEKIVFLLKNRERALEMGEAGKRRVTQYFTICRMIKETEAVYDYWLKRNAGDYLLSLS